MVRVVIADVSCHYALHHASTEQAGTGCAEGERAVAGEGGPFAAADGESTSSAPGYARQASVSRREPQAEGRSLTLAACLMGEQTRQSIISISAGAASANAFLAARGVAVPATWAAQGSAGPKAVVSSCVTRRSQRSWPSSLRLLPSRSSLRILLAPGVPNRPRPVSASSHEQLSLVRHPSSRRPAAQRPSAQCIALSAPGKLALA